MIENVLGVVLIKKPEDSVYLPKMVVPMLINAYSARWQRLSFAKTIP
jgi:hypothetical protein